jgi:amidohydrolase
MHACGHDGHVAVLMGVAETLAGMKKDIKGTVVFIFQPAEEGAPKGEEGGAALMVKEGVLNNPKVDVIFGLHMNAQLEVGKITYRPGGMFAGVDDMKITVKGKPSHGAEPWASVDPIVVSAQIINVLQTVVSRNVNITQNAAVVTIGAIHGGNRSNIISEEVEMLGTVRTLSDSDRELVLSRIRQLVEKTAEGAGATVAIWSYRIRLRIRLRLIMRNLPLPCFLRSTISRYRECYTGSGRNRLRRFFIFCAASTGAVFLYRRLAQGKRSGHICSASYA